MLLPPIRSLRPTKNIVFDAIKQAGFEWMGEKWLPREDVGAPACQVVAVPFSPPNAEHAL